MSRRDGLYYVVDETASFSRRQWVEAMQRAERRCAERRRREGGTEGTACTWPGGEPFMRAPDPASHTGAPSEWDERGELG